jgi:hypothetical protein
MRRELGRSQRDTLDKLRKFGSWSIGCTWHWDSPNFTQRILESLVKGGYVVKEHVDGKPAIYRAKSDGAGGRDRTDTSEVETQHAAHYATPAGIETDKKPEVRIAETLATAIAGAGFVVDQITISDDAAVALSVELAAMQVPPAADPAFFYHQLKAGKHKFMDVPIVVTEE